MKKILGIGSALVDILIRLQDDAALVQLGLPKGSMQLVDQSQRDSILSVFEGFTKNLAAGGSAANTIHGIGKLGGPAGFIGIIGQDKLGDSFVNDMKNAGVEVHILRSPTPTGCATTLISPDSERTFATYLGASSELSPTHLETLRPIFAQYDIFHIEGYLVFNQLLTEAAIKMAKEAGLLVSIDLASYNVVEANRDFLHRIVRDYVDIVFANEEEARAFTGKEPEEALADISHLASWAIVKTGSKGSLIHHNGVTCRIGVIPVTPADTTGAGDLYASGFLYGMANGLTLQQCGELGALLAGKVIEVMGAKMDEARWTEIKQTGQGLNS